MGCIRGSRFLYNLGARTHQDCCMGISVRKSVQEIIGRNRSNCLFG
jgi:hypothetical protein